MRVVMAVIVAGLSVAGAAWAANGGEADPGLLLGAIPTFPSREAARQVCGQDAVVWADRYSGYYYDAGEAKFGVTKDGGFACRGDARRGNYWDTSPTSDMSGHPGRSFPFEPLFVGS